jgi:hypothetical protein
MPATKSSAELNVITAEAYEFLSIEIASPNLVTFRSHCLKVFIRSVNQKERLAFLRGNL